MLTCNNCPAWKDSVFSELDDESIIKLSKCKTPNIYKKGQTLFMEDNPSYGLFCIQKGNIKISKMSKNGKDAIVRIASKGNIVGHRSIFAHQPYQATGTSLSETRACFIDKNHLLDLVTKDASVASKILSHLAMDLGVSENKVASFTQKNVRERVASLLLFLKGKYGDVTENGTLLKISLSRDELASLVGTATETLIRSFSEFNEEKLINLQHKNIIVLDPEKLSEIANEKEKD